MANNSESGTFFQRPFSSEQLIARFQAAKNTLRFVHISDTHICHDPNYNLPEATFTPLEGARALVEQLNHLPFTPDFILHTGDVAYDPDAAAYIAAREVLSKIKYPVHYLAGNHDKSEDLQRIFLQRPTIRTPFSYDFEIKGMHVVCLDSNGPAKRPAGLVDDEQLGWLEKICSNPADTRPLVIAVHHNTLPTGIPWWDEFMRMTNGEAFHKVLLGARHRLRGVFHGHIHQSTDTYRDGILYSGVASSWYQLHSWPDQVNTLGDEYGVPGFNVVTVTPDQTFIRRHAFKVKHEE
jgi:3',5'-cyclic-AMP phosphodiesterase